MSRDFLRRYALPKPKTGRDIWGRIKTAASKVAVFGVMCYLVFLGVVVPGYVASQLVSQFLETKVIQPDVKSTIPADSSTSQLIDTLNKGLMEARREPLVLGLSTEWGAFRFSRTGERWMIDLNPGYYIIKPAPDQKHYVLPDPSRFCAQRGEIEPYCNEPNGIIIMLPDMLYGKDINDPLLFGDLMKFQPNN